MAAESALSAERREQLLEGACRRLHEIAHRMLRRFPQVRRWEETTRRFVQRLGDLPGMTEGGGDDGLH